LFSFPGTPVVAFAGLWECWKSPAGDEIESCSLITTEPNALAASIHDWMPVILDRIDYGM
jgi:putative SOS response-associated peptidase YedK